MLLHSLPVRVKTHAAPRSAWSVGAPTIAVLPSADSATLCPKPHSAASAPHCFAAAGFFFVDRQLGPLLSQVEPERVNTHAAAPYAGADDPRCCRLPESATL